MRPRGTARRACPQAPPRADHLLFGGLQSTVGVAIIVNEVAMITLLCWVSIIAYYYNGGA